MSEKAHGYSIWLMPPEDSYAHRTFLRMIASVGMVSSSPAFGPHVTLLGGINGDEGVVQEKTEILARHIPQFVSINFVSIERGNEFFKCLYVKVVSSPALLSAWKEAVRIFGLNTDRFDPHLSLGYGLTPPERRSAEEKIETLNFRIESLSFRASSLHLYHTEGEVSEWYQVDEYRCS